MHIAVFLQPWNTLQKSFHRGEHCITDTILSMKADMDMDFDSDMGSDSEVEVELGWQRHFLREGRQRAREPHRVWEWDFDLHRWGVRVGLWEAGRESTGVFCLFTDAGSKSGIIFRDNSLMAFLHLFIHLWSFDGVISIWNKSEIHQLSCLCQWVKSCYLQAKSLYTDLQHFLVFQLELQR